MRNLASAFLAATLAAGCALPAPELSPNGRRSRLRMPTEQVIGELIAVTPDTVWLLTKAGGTLVPFDAKSVDRLDVQRHRMGGTRTLQIMSLVGAVTGALLMASCVQVDDADCGAVFPGALLTYIGVGAVFALVNSESAWMKYTPSQFIIAKPYARFPQGLPDTLRTSHRPTSP